ncbi:MAG: TIGR02300 family protein [Sphingopyxis sp.]
MIKPEWGVKRSCPKCATRFYDLTQDDPITCISCGYAWNPEPVLKSKQPMPFEQLKPGVADDAAETVGADSDLDLDADVDDDNVSPDNDVDLGGDDDLGVDGPEKGDDDV